MLSEKKSSAKHKRPHTVQSQLYMKHPEVKSTEKTDQWSPRAGEAGNVQRLA